MWLFLCFVLNHSYFVDIQRCSVSSLGKKQDREEPHKKLMQVPLSNTEIKRRKWKAKSIGKGIFCSVLNKKLTWHQFIKTLKPRTIEKNNSVCLILTRDWGLIFSGTEWTSKANRMVYYVCLVSLFRNLLKRSLDEICRSTVYNLGFSW